MMMENPIPNMEIDAVIAWVDGNDPAFIKKREKYTENKEDLKRDDIAGPLRFTEAGEIEFCLSSILTFAPFFRNIFIITDNQIPPIAGLLEKNFPDQAHKIKIVDHSVIFRGYEKYLPVFNANGIETMMWRIPGLAEHFVYFNDDFFLAAPVKVSDFFDKEGNPIANAKIYKAFWLRVLKFLKPSRHGHKEFGFKDMMLNSADYACKSVVPVIGHTPHPLRKSYVASVYEAHPELIDINLRHRFRDPEQFQTQVLTYLLTPHSRRDYSDVLLFMKPKAGRKGYIERKLKEGDSKPHLLFGCMNSYFETTPEERKMFREWLDRRMKSGHK